MSTHKQTFLAPMTQPDRPIYLDCAATTPIDPRVREVVLHYMDVEFGNAGSRTHIYGQEAAKGVKKAREQLAAVVDAKPEEVIFTSGATEANNLATLGLAQYGMNTAKRHIISTQIEHNAVLEPLEHLSKNGFEVELIPSLPYGYVDPDEIGRRIRDDTLLVSVMHVNNETGVVQPLDAIANRLRHSDAFFHVDSAQGFCKELSHLANPRIDAISASGHKLHAPSGVGCLVLRSTRKIHRHIQPLLRGGKQERGIRPGTIPTALLCGFGEAASLAVNEHTSRRQKWVMRRTEFTNALQSFSYTIHGEEALILPNILNFRIQNIDADFLIHALRDDIAISNGSACTSDSFTNSHVISAMYPATIFAEQACRASWSHLTPEIDSAAIAQSIFRALS